MDHSNNFALTNSSRKCVFNFILVNLFSEIIDKQHEFRDAETLNEEYRSTLVELSEKEVNLIILSNSHQSRAFL